MRPVAVLPLIVIFGCGPRAASPPPEPAPPPVSRGAGPTPYSPPPPEVCPCITICVVRDGNLQDLSAAWDSRRGVMLTRDSLPITEIAPLTGEYASVAGWYVNNEAIIFRGMRYIRYGLPRVLAIDEIERAGEYGGVPIFIEAGDTTSVPILYLPSRPGCEFAPFTPLATK